MTNYDALFCPERQERFTEAHLNFFRGVQKLVDKRKDKERGMNKEVCTAIYELIKELESEYAKSNRVADKRGVLGEYSKASIHQQHAAGVRTAINTAYAFIGKNSCTI